MQHIGYRESIEMDDPMRGFHEANLKKAATLAKLNSPLDVTEQQSLLLKSLPAGKLVLTVGDPWVRCSSSGTVWLGRHA